MVFLYPLTMKLEELPFKIGMHYEHWEFDLEVVEDNFEPEKYKYLGNEINSLLGLVITDIYLYFSWDILIKTELFFYFIHPINTYTKLKKQLINTTEVLQISSIEDAGLLFTATFKSKTGKLHYRIQLQNNIISLSISENN